MKSPFLCPAIVTQTFGGNPVYYKPLGVNGHEGIDVVPVNKVGANYGVHALFDGVVIEDSDVPGRIYGNIVRIRSIDGQVWAYAHMTENCVSLGDAVKKNQLIGIMGNTGTGTGDHVHIMTYFQAEDGSRKDADNGFKGCVDPTPYLS